MLREREKDYCMLHKLHFQTVINLEKERKLSLYAEDTLIYIPIAELVFFDLDFFNSENKN